MYRILLGVNFLLKLSSEFVACLQSTERFQAIYPTLKELALAGSPGTKALKQVSQQLLDVAVRAMSESKLNH